MWLKRGFVYIRDSKFWYGTACIDLEAGRLVEAHNTRRYDVQQVREDQVQYKDTRRVKSGTEHMFRFTMGEVW